MTITPADEDRIAHLIDLTRALSDVFAEENALLATQRPSAIAPLQAEKSRLAAAYATAIRDIAHNRHLVEGTEDTMLETLRHMTDRFNSLATDQKNLLAGANRARIAVVQAIAAEADAGPAKSGTREFSSVYKPAGMNASPSASTPISINERA